MGKGATNKTKGSNAERLYAKIFKDLGYKFCVTARYGSRCLDDAGVDLMNLPFNVQIKAGFQKNMNPLKVLEVIEERLPEMFPPENEIHTYPNVLIHRNQIGRGNKRVPEDDLVYIKPSDFSEFTSAFMSDNLELHYFTKHGNKTKWTEKSVILENKVKEKEVTILHHKRNNSNILVMSFQDFTKILKEINQWE